MNQCYLHLYSIHGTSFLSNDDRGIGFLNISTVFGPGFTFSVSKQCYVVGVGVVVLFIDMFCTIGILFPLIASVLCVLILARFFT